MNASRMNELTERFNANLEAKGCGRLSLKGAEILKETLKEMFAIWGKEGGTKRSKNMTAEEKSAAGRKAAYTRWGKEPFKPAKKQEVDGEGPLDGPLIKLFRED